MLINLYHFPGDRLHRGPLGKDMFIINKCRTRLKSVSDPDLGRCNALHDGIHTGASRIFVDDVFAIPVLRGKIMIFYLIKQVKLFTINKMLMITVF